MDFLYHILFHYILRFLVEKFDAWFNRHYSERYAAWVLRHPTVLMLYRDVIGRDDTAYMTRRELFQSGFRHLILAVILAGAWLAFSWLLLEKGGFPNGNLPAPLAIGGVVVMMVLLVLPVVLQQCSPQDV
jgi:hypothetical protein